MNHTHLHVHTYAHAEEVSYHKLLLNGNTHTHQTSFRLWLINHNENNQMSQCIGCQENFLVTFFWVKLNIQMDQITRELWLNISRILSFKSEYDWVSGEPRFWRISLPPPTLLSSTVLDQNTARRGKRIHFWKPSETQAQVYICWGLLF